MVFNVTFGYLEIFSFPLLGYYYLSPVVVYRYQLPSSVILCKGQFLWLLSFIFGKFVYASISIFSSKSKTTTQLINKHCMQTYHFSAIRDCNEIPLKNHENTCCSLVFLSNGQLNTCSIKR